MGAHSQLVKKHNKSRVYQFHRNQSTYEVQGTLLWDVASNRPLKLSFESKSALRLTLCERPSRGSKKAAPGSRKTDALTLRQTIWEGQLTITNDWK